MRTDQTAYQVAASTPIAHDDGYYACTEADAGAHAHAHAHACVHAGAEATIDALLPYLDRELYVALVANGYLTIAQVSQVADSELLRLRQVGRYRVAQLRMALTQYERQKLRGEQQKGEQQKGEQLTARAVLLSATWLFPELPAYLRNILWKAGYRGRATVRQASDEALQTVVGMSRQRLRLVRAYLPYLYVPGQAVVSAASTLDVCPETSIQPDIRGEL